MKNLSFLNYHPRFDRIGTLCYTIPLDQAVITINVPLILKSRDITVFFCGQDAEGISMDISR